MNNSWWTYSIALFIAWGIALTLVWRIKGKADFKKALLVFFGFLIGWLSTTIKHFLLLR